MNDKTIHILSTKKLDETLINRAASENIIIDCIPFIEILPIENDQLREAVNGIAKEKVYVIFTSVNAVNAVTALIDTSPEWNIFCISGATREAAEGHFKNAKILATASYGADLVKEILQQNIDRLIFFCGDKRLDTIPDALTRGGMPFEEYIVYETLLTPGKVDKNYDGICFFSPSGVRSFFGANVPDKNAVAFSIGKTTGKELEKYTGKIVTSVETSGQSMIETVISYFNSK